MVASPPHFYQGNKSLLKSVHGLHPTKSADETYVDVEPVSKEMNDQKWELRTLFFIRTFVFIRTLRLRFVEILRTY